MCTAAPGTIYWMTNTSAIGYPKWFNTFIVGLGSGDTG